MPLEKNLALYSWHGRHHVAHVTELRKKMGWWWTRCWLLVSTAGL